MEARLIDAGILLFGRQVRAGGIAFLSTLDPAAVRRAYRALAMAAHPDKARGAGRGAEGRQFIEISRAYELVMGWLLAQRAASRGPRPARPRASAGTRPAEEKRRPDGARRDARDQGKKARGGSAGPGSAPLFYRGTVPRRKLRLAEYLYYTGRVSWQSMIKAIVWQRSVQPRFGEIARELSRISSQDLWRILGSKLRHEHTGEAAQRLRILSAAEVERILRFQRARHRRIGAYFVEEEKMPGPALAELLRELHRHNARWTRAT